LPGEGIGLRIQILVRVGERRYQLAEMVEDVISLAGATGAANARRVAAGAVRRQAGQPRAETRQTPAGYPPDRRELAWDRFK